MSFFRWICRNNRILNWAIEFILWMCYNLISVLSIFADVVYLQNGKTMEWEMREEQNSRNDPKKVGVCHALIA